MEGIKEGLKLGIEQGARKSATDITLLLLQRKFGRVSASARQRILTLSAEQLQDLAIALMDFGSPKDLSSWLSRRA
jgi:hypothetical protein